MTSLPSVSAGGYRVLPAVYDRWQHSYGKDYSTLILPRLLETLRMFRVGRGTMLDVACGTGTLALHMARRGWGVWGVDGSRGMIAAARSKRPPRGAEVHFLRQDMRRLRLPVKADLATCLFDSLNHLPRESDLLLAFRAVAAALRDRGWFVFDVNNERCFRKLWTRTELFHSHDYSLILQNSYNPLRAAACSVVTLFHREGETFSRRREVVCERYYTRRGIAALLREAGFVVKSAEDFNFTSNPALGKIKTWWVARKRR